MNKQWGLFIFLSCLHLLKFSLMSHANNEWLLLIKHLLWTGKAQNYSVLPPAAHSHTLN